MSPSSLFGTNRKEPLRPECKIATGFKSWSYANEYLKANTSLMDKEVTKPTMSKDSHVVVEKYLQEHDLEAVMNEVVNKCVKERPCVCVVCVCMFC